MLWLFAISAVFGQDLGHKLPGNVGLDAGRGAEPGMAIVDKALWYGASDYRDREGRPIAPDDFRMDALADAIGVSGTVPLGVLDTRLTATVALPVAWVRVRDAGVQAAVDRFGLTDVFFQPVRLSWKRGAWDAVAGYAVYVPTGLSPLAGGQGLSSGHVTHQVSAGGAAYAGPWVVTALASYDHHLKKDDVDIRRGDTLQIEGGVGVRFAKGLELGVAGAALWQVTDDTGSDVPPPLVGARDRSIGVGPEIAVPVPSLRLAFRARYERDVGVLSRPEGDLVVVGVRFGAIVPPPPSGTLAGARGASSEPRAR